jgi:acetylornithine deacetylase/succinyl-diaminopimelate desuccinylase-like protein
MLATVRALAASLGTVFRRIQDVDQALIDDQIAIARVPAPTGDESARAEWMVRRLQVSGLRNVGIDAAGNVIGSSGNLTRDSTPPIVLCAHLDTVFETRDPVPVHRDGIRLQAPGISDNARGLATLVSLADLVGSGRLVTRRPIVFAATTGEEGHGDLRGARYLFDTAGASAHLAIALDGPGDERIVTSALGCRRYHVAFRGPGGHSWGRYGAPNAIHAAAALVTRLTGYAAYDRARTALTVSRIAGGTTINAIPAESWIEVDVRSTSDAELVRIDQHIRRAARDAGDEENARRRADTPPLSTTLTLIGERPAGEVSTDHDIVVAAGEATRAVGRTPEYAVASTDANIPISRGIPAVAIGGGGAGGDTHTPTEWFENREGSRGIVRAALLLAALAGAR